MLPDYIIYDELEKEREDSNERPRVEIPKNPPPEFEHPEEQEEDEEDEEETPDRGVTIIQI